MNFNNRQDLFADRLNLAMQQRQINQVELAEKTKLYGKYISQSLINKYLKGKALARQDNIYVLSKILDVDEGWLMGFDVPIARKTESSNIFQYTMTDKSMYPLLDINDIAYILRKNNFASGETILFTLEKEEYIRRIIEIDNYYEFQAFNSYFPIMKYTKKKLNKKDFRVIGKVIKAENQSAFK